MHKQATDPDVILRRQMTPDAAFRRAADALNAIGRVTERDDARRRIEAEVGDLGRQVELEVRVKADGDAAVVEVLAFSWRGFSINDGALCRFEEAFDRLHDPDYRPNRDDFPTWLLIAGPAAAVVFWLLERLGLLPS